VVDRHHGVIDRRVQHRQLVGRMDRRRLVARRGLEVEQESVPVDDRIDGGSGLWRLCGPAGRCRAADGRQRQRQR
jgi:hypothetical protein